jgi:hypothetical protein
MFGLSKRTIGMVRQWVTYLASGLFVVLIIVGAVAYFSSSVSKEFFAAFGFVIVLLGLAAAYFRYLAVKSLGLFIAAFVVLVGGVFWAKMPKVESGHFQAVFLTNGQVYFGHLHNPNSAEPTLTDIYYLQSNSANPQTSSTDSQNPLSLIKLGNELHGPQDHMVLQARQILFWEDMKDNSKVVQVINTGQVK